MTVKWIHNPYGHSVSAWLAPDLRIGAYYYTLASRHDDALPYRAFVFKETLPRHFSTIEEAKTAAVAEAKKQIAQAAAALGVHTMEQNT